MENNIQDDLNIQKTKMNFLQTEAYHFFQKLVADVLDKRPVDIVITLMPIFTSLLLNFLNSIYF